MKTSTAITRPQRRKVNHKVIAAAAERALDRLGYRKTTVVDVATELGMSSANIYRFYGSKDDLRSAVLKRMLDANFQLAVRITKSSGRAAQRLTRLAGMQFTESGRLITGRPALFDLLRHAFVRNDVLLKHHFERMTELIQLVIEDGIRSGEFGHQRADKTARLFVVSSASLWHPTLLANQAQSASVHAEDFIHFILNGINHLE